MVNNIWSQTKLFCNNSHPSPTQMSIQTQGKKMYYCCPLCKNKVTIQQFEKMLDYLSNEITEAEMNGSEINLSNHRWKKGQISYLVTEHNKENIMIEVLNIEEIRK